MATIILMFIYNILLFVLPIDVVVGHFCSPTITWLCIIIYGIVYHFFPMIPNLHPYVLMIPDIIIHILFLIGAYFAYTDFPLGAFIFYIIIMISLYIRTIYKTIRSRDEL